MRVQRRFGLVAGGAAGLLIWWIAGHATPRAQAPARGAAAPTVYVGARLIPGDERPPIENGAFVVDGDRITAIGRRDAVTPPPRAATVDLTGKTVMPALINV